MGQIDLTLLGVDEMRKILSRLALAAAATVGVASSAQAYVILTLTDQTPAGGGATISCSTLTALGGCSADFSYVVGGNSISFGNLLTGANIGNFNVQTTIGLSTSGPNNATIDTTSLRVQRTDGDTTIKQDLLISFTAVDLFAPPDEIKTLSGSGSQTSGIGITAGDQVVTRVAVNANNTTSFFPPLYGTNGTDMWAMGCTFQAATSARCDATDTGAPGGSELVVWSDPATSAAGFSMQSQQQFRLGANAIINTTSSEVVGRVPEPMTTLLVGVGLFGLALTSRRSGARKV